MVAVDVPRWRVTVPPAVEPVPLADLKSHLRVVGTGDDGYIAGLGVAARQEIERIQGRASVTQTRILYLDAFPDGDVIELPGAPLQSVTSVSYTNEDDVTAAFSSSAYRVDTESMPGRVLLKDGESWPSDTLVEVNGVAITYVCGYAPVTSTVTISQATPGVVTWSSHGLSAGYPVWISSTGSIPGGLTAERTYYLAQVAAGTFQLANAPSGSSIATTSAGSGTHTAYSLWRLLSSTQISHAIKLLAAYRYEQREAATEARIEEAPLAFQTLLDADRLWGFA